MSKPKTRLRRFHRVDRGLLSVLVVAVAVVGIKVVFFSHAAGPVATQAKSVYSFVDSLGVNVHGAGYDDYANASQVAGWVKNLGITHIRDNPGASDKDDLGTYAANGLHFILNVGCPPRNTSTGLGFLPTAMGYAKAYPANTDGIEGANEVDGYCAQNPTNPDWASEAKAFQFRMYQAIKSDPTLSSMPVIGNSLTTVGLAAKSLALGNMYSALDIANVHSYPGSNWPEIGGGDNVSFAARYATQKKNNFAGSPDKPYYTTESGYHDLLSWTGGHYPVDQAAAGVYTPRIFFEHFRLGSKRTYIYELLDQNQRLASTNNQAHFGLYNGNRQLKPSGQVIKNLTTILAGAKNTPAGKLTYCTCGAPSDIHQVLLQHSDGSYWLALWRANSIFNHATNTSGGITASEPVTLSFDQPRQLAWYRPNVGTAATSLGTTSTTTVQVDSRIMLVKVSGAASTPSSQPTLVGDVNRDGKVNIYDLSALVSVWGTANAAADLNHDGTVNIFDLSNLLNNWTK